MSQWPEVVVKHGHIHLKKNQRIIFKNVLDLSHSRLQSLILTYN